MILLNRLKTYEYITALVASFPLMGLKGGVYVVILWSVYSLYIAISMKSYKLTNNDIKNVAVLSVLYLAYIVSYFFADDKREVGKLLERALPFLLFPLFMIMNKQFITKQALILSLKVFVASCILLSLYVWGVIFYKGIDNVFSEDNYYNPVIRNIFNDVSGIHLPYLGMLFVFASLILLYNMLVNRKANGYLKRLLQLVGIVFLLFSVATFMARMALFIFFIVAVFFCLKQMKTLKQLAIAGIVGLIIIGSVLMLPSSQRRIKEGLATEYVLPHAGQPSEQVNFRFGVYHCVQQVLKEHWLTGVGVDNVQKKLNECYSVYTYRASDDYININYNSHNQYFDIMLKYGIFGLIIFLISLFWGVKNKYIVYQGFIIVIFIALLTENIFSRQVGVLFFTFFNTLFFVTKEQKTLNKI
ncbi:O-antigen ligase family protein [Flavobacterium sp. AG291]|uniref:O-antigen ligase family protein n=1 Tax=Flavobacterium sp. AG291 TaxID=2184000 RepID=UPI000E0AC429|nr:O-antigen ligase family protein [Flavobacterium sp. AG291]RDI07968.1 O-antigen ligase [Flavobacterium sp. AG291]